MVHLLIFVRISKAWPDQAFLLIWDMFLQCRQVGYIRISKPIKGYSHQAIICYGINYCIIPTKKVKELFLIPPNLKTRKMMLQMFLKSQLPTNDDIQKLWIISYSSPNLNKNISLQSQNEGYENQHSIIYMYRVNYIMKPLHIYK